MYEHFCLYVLIAGPLTINTINYFSTQIADSCLQLYEM
jgi:hypothetical protein